MMREKNISSRFRTRACHGIIIIMAWHNNTVLYIIRCTTRCLPVVCPLRAQGMCRGAMPCLPVVCPCGCVPRPGGARGKAAGGGKMSKSAGRAGENRKKTEKVEKKSLKSLEIRQRALPLQSRSGRGPLGLLRGSGEVH